MSSNVLFSKGDRRSYYEDMQAQRQKENSSQLARLEFSKKNNILLNNCNKQLPFSALIRYTFEQNGELPFQNEYRQREKSGVSNALIQCIKSGRVDKNSLRKKSNPGMVKTVFSNTLDEEIDKYVKGRVCLFTPATFFGLSRSEERVHYSYGLGVDIDKVDSACLNRLLYDLYKGELPKPNVITNSGNGIHLFFMFKDPVKIANKHVKGYLKEVMNFLQDKFWIEGLYSNEKKGPRLSFVQGYRSPGSYTKFGTIVESYLYSEEKWEINKLASALDFDVKLEEFVSLNEKESSLTKEDKNKKTWATNRKLVDWYIKRVKEEEPRVGYRYFTLLNLATYAAKSRLSSSELSEKMDEVHEYFISKNLGMEDYKAIKRDILKLFNDEDGKWRFINTRRETMSKRSLFTIEGTKGRTGIENNRKNHMKKARACIDRNKERIRRETGIRDKKEEKRIIRQIRENPLESTNSISKKVNCSRKKVEKAKKGLNIDVRAFLVYRISVLKRKTRKLDTSAQELADFLNCSKSFITDNWTEIKKMLKYFNRNLMESLDKFMPPTNSESYKGKLDCFYAIARKYGFKKGCYELSWVDKYYNPESYGIRKGSLEWYRLLEFAKEQSKKLRERGMNWSWKEYREPYYWWSY